MLSLVTRITPNEVVYTIERGDSVLWRRTVVFSSHASNRPGGASFRIMAREQERTAARLMEKDERVEERFLTSDPRQDQGGA